MPYHNANPVLKYVAFAALATVVGYVVFIAIPGRKGPDMVSAETGEGQSELLPELLVSVGGESETTSETLNTLVAQLSQQNKEQADLRRSLEQRLKDQEAQIRSLERKKSAPALNAPSLSDLTSADSQLIQNLQGQIDNLKSQFIHDEDDTENDFDIGISPTEVPITQDGIPSLSDPLAQPNTLGLTNVANESEGDWIEPMDNSTTTNTHGHEETALPDFSPNKMFSNPFRDASLREKASHMMGVQEESDSALIPVYTIPENATLVKVMTRTALLGRIPLQGSLTDPYRFKLLIGPENLATNGHRIPGLHGMIVSGVAKGDYTLKCVSGDITSVTYTFTDGTIRTISQDSEKNTENSQAERLGYIADNQGVPCISGKFISNGAEYLSQSVGTDMFAAAAGAFANQEKVFTSNSDGSMSSEVTGNSYQNMAGEGVKAGANTASDWVKQRQQSAFDAVYVGPGVPVEIHIERELEIDYDTQGRKVSHHAQSNSGHQRGLD